MTVIEFILAYWDWWLAAGVIFTVAFCIDERTTVGLTGIVAFIILPPTYVLLHIQHMVRKINNVRKEE